MKINPCVFAIIIALIFGISFIFGWSIKDSPKVVVNMPANTQPMQTIPKDAQIVPQEKAVLWWTVYKFTMEKRNDSRWAVYSADEAVRTAYK